MRALSEPWPPDKETLNEALEWQWWQGGHRAAPLSWAARATSQTQGEAVCPQGSGQRAWEAELGPSLPGAATAEQALPAPFHNPICL